MPVDKPHPSVDLTIKANGAETTPAVDTSPGVRRIEILARHITVVERVFLLFGVFLIAYAYSIDATLRSVFQPNATSEFSQHSLLATITVLRSVIAGAAQPTAAKIADVFGRLELIVVSIVFHIVGTVIEATSHGVKGFAAGAVFYQVGYTCATLLAEVIIADMTSLRSRLLFSYIFASPYLINTWVSGDISAAVLTHVGWRWGIGMWAIIYPVATLPLISVLMVARYRAKKSGDLATVKTPYQMYGARHIVQALFWQLDAPGIVLLIAVFALILVPFTIAGGEQQQWRTGHVIAPLVVGVLCIPAFIIWEKRAPNPMLPFHLLKDRAVWAALYLAVGIGCTWYIQGDYLYTVLVVSYNESVKSATRITQLYSFVSAVTGLVLGLIVYKVRRLKWFIVFGAAVYLVAFGLLIQFRGGGGANHAGLVGAQVVLGVGGSMLSYPAQTSIQAAAKHEHVAVITGLSLGFLSIGSALGNCISGAIWTQVLPTQLNKALEPFGNATLPALVYGAPFLVVPEYPWGSPVREAIVEAYRHTQRLLCITAICIATTLVGFALALRNYRLPDTQSRPDAEKSLAVHPMVVAVVETPEKV